MIWFSYQNGVGEVKKGWTYRVIILEHFLKCIFIITMDDFLDCFFQFCCVDQLGVGYNGSSIIGYIFLDFL